MFMPEKFNPAPQDKHADPVSKGHGKKGDELERGLEESFPASDPPSSTQPGASKPDKT
jgi:hypothetical protein